MSLVILSIDPSSTCSGVALFKNEKPIKIGNHKSDKSDTLGGNLDRFANFLDGFVGKQKVNLVVVEQVHVPRNLHTVRLLAYFECVCIQKAHEWGAKCDLVIVKTARKTVFGNGAISKEEIYKKLSVKYDLSPEKEGGLDESDALTLGFHAYHNYKEMHKM